MLASIIEMQTQTGLQIGVMLIFTIFIVTVTNSLITSWHQNIVQIPSLYQMVIVL